MPEKTWPHRDGALSTWASTGQETLARCAKDTDTNLALRNAFGGFKLVGRETELLPNARVPGRGSLNINAGTFVSQVFR